MRQIKFRAKTVNEGEWIYGMTIAYGTILRKSNDLFMEVASNKWKGVDKDTLGQFTGLIDCNGKEIYEGDIICTPLNNKVIVKYGYKEHIVRHNGLVDSFAAYGWIAKNIQNGITDFLDNDILQGEVVSNIHDNPALLEK